jgi:proteasome lid subunit RPN8/RPN11
MQEAGVVIAKLGEPIHWHLPDARSGGALPDDRTLWNVLWDNRDKLAGVAHSHPGSGLPGPSYEDVTTFAAIEAGLGVRLKWWIVSSDSAVLCEWIGPDRLTYSVTPISERSMDAEYFPKFTKWVSELRRVSNYNNI